MVFWLFLFILIFYMMVFVYVVFVKYEVLINLVEIFIVRLLSWVVVWMKVGLVIIEDINCDGIL